MVAVAERLTKKVDLKVKGGSRGFEKKILINVNSSISGGKS